jgi:predicted O-methyltransferase YrrM
MPLTEVRLELDEAEVPGDVRRFLEETNRRIDAFQHESRVPGFVSTDLERAYRVLRTVAQGRLTPGAMFCEWGSGFGAIACLAAMLDFDAVGIEIEAELVEAARQLADDFDVPVEFIQGSFIPRGSAVQTEIGMGFAWLKPEEAEPGELGFDPDDFDIIFAYPWPDEEDVAAALFERHGRPGALLVTYHGGDVFRLRRKVAKKTRR